MENGKMVILTTFQETHETFNSKDLIWAKVKSNIKTISRISNSHSMQIIQLLDK